MRDYEVTIIVQPQLDDEERTQLITRVRDWLAPEVEEEDKPIVNHWGQRHLAYPIQKHTEGYYVLYEGKIDPTRIHEVERNMQYNEDILRYLFIRKTG